MWLRLKGSWTDEIIGLSMGSFHNSHVVMVSFLNRDYDNPYLSRPSGVYYHTFSPPRPVELRLGLLSLRKQCL